jgi:hypothetical protein
MNVFRNLQLCVDRHRIQKMNTFTLSNIKTTLTAVGQSNGRDIQFRGLFFGTRSGRFAYGCTKTIIKFLISVSRLKNNFLKDRKSFEK